MLYRRRIIKEVLPPKELYIPNKSFENESNNKEKIKHYYPPTRYNNNPKT